MSAPVVDQAALQAAYLTQQATTRATVAAYLNLMWAKLTSWRTPDADAFAQQAAAVVAGGQQRTAAITAAYLAHAVTAAGGKAGTANLAGLDDTGIRGVPAQQVYRRPFEQLWWDLSKDVPLPDAVGSAGDRLQELAASDLQLAKTHTSQRILSRSTGVVGARRALSAKSTHCALCLLVADRVYKKQDLQPMHPGCGCTPVPVFAGQDPAPQVDPAAVHDAVRADLGDKYVSASGRRGAEDYRHLVVVHQHGELGPVLSVAGQNWRGDPLH